VRGRGRGGAPGSSPARAQGARAAAAIDAFLDAVLPAQTRSEPDLAGTPARVAEAWLADLVDGYQQDPAALLAEAMPARGRDLVAVTGIDYHSMCPHHLLPSRGVAHVAYLPGGRVVGFGQIARLVDCFAHRLVLQEELARQVAEAIVEHLGARGAACVLDAEQSCLTVRGERRRAARTHAQCFVGAMAEDVRLQARFRSLVEGGARRRGTSPRPTGSGSRSRSGSGPFDSASPEATLRSGRTDPRSKRRSRSRRAR
jgi:GTP cyclohydrolase I